MMRKVAVVIGPSKDGKMDAVYAASDRIREALSKLDGVSSVTSRVDMSEAKAAAEAVLSHAARLVRPEDIPKSASDMEARINSLKERLAAPEAMIMGEYLLKDPFGLGRSALVALEAVGRAQGARVENGRLVSIDGRHALIFLDLSFDAFDVERATPFVEELDRTIEGAMRSARASDIPYLALGGVHFAAASKASFMSDLTMCSIGITVLVAAVFLLFFRRLRLLVAALVPGLLGGAVAAGVMGFASMRVHALTLGFASTITGISIDYAIHLFHRALAGAKGSQFGDSEEDTKTRMIRALQISAGPVTIGCATAVAAFLLTATSDFISVRQLAVFASISITVSLLTSLFLLPSFHRLLLGGKGPHLRDFSERCSKAFVRVAGTGASLRKRTLVIVVFAVLFCLSAFGITRVTLSGDPKYLGYTPPALKNRQAEIARLFPGASDQTLITAEGETEDAALARNDALYDALRGAGIPKEDIVSISPFAPALSSQSRSLEASKKLLSQNSPGRAALLLAGFQGEYVDGIGAMIKASPLLPKDYQGTGLSRMVTESIAKQNGKWYVMTRIQNTVAVDRLTAVADRISGCRLVSERLETSRAFIVMQGDLIRMMGIWGIAALVLIAVVKRSVLFSLRAVLPPVFGVLAAAGLFGFLGKPLTPVASAALTMVLGLGINYGVYVENEPLSGLDNAAGAIFADALTTIVGFLVLAFAKNPAMADIGIIVTFGLTAAMFCAVIALPALRSSH
jgi:predicted exporter